MPGLVQVRSCGYPTNETGFGWTNAVVLELLTFLGWDILRG